MFPGNWTHNLFPFTTEPQEHILCHTKPCFYEQNNLRASYDIKRSEEVETAALAFLSNIMSPIWQSWVDYLLIVIITDYMIKL